LDARDARLDIDTPRFATRKSPFVTGKTSLVA
jgi:hypothetical protein